MRDTQAYVLRAQTKSFRYAVFCAQPLGKNKHTHKKSFFSFLCIVFLKCKVCECLKKKKEKERAEQEGILPSWGRVVAEGKVRQPACRL